MNRTGPHQELVRDIRLALGREQWIVLWPRVNGRGILPDGTPVNFGLVGAGDLWGILTRARDHAGLHVEIECKTGGAVQRKAQKLFQEMAVQRGAIYLIARSLDQTLLDLRSLRDS